LENSRIFTGTIMLCTKYKKVPHLISDGMAFGHIETEAKVYKENAVLVRIKDNAYVDIEGLSLLDIVHLYLENEKRIKNNELCMPSLPSGLYEEQLYVDSNSLKPYVTTDKKQKNISLMKIKRQKSRKQF